MIFLELFLTYLMIGTVTFGGGYAMLPMIQEQVALRWGDIISQQALVDFVAVSESTPGPFAINMATYIGSVVGGQQGGVPMSIFGSFCATMGVVLPSFVIILIVARCYDKFKENKIVKGCMTGLKPAVAGLIGGAIINVMATVFFPAGYTFAVLTDVAFYVSLAIFVVMTVLALKKVHPILIICLSAVVGIAAGYLGIL
ncbi:MAG: chromate transporter [Oscillospiraceae bacterium]|nr:chromate transporter [Oscillospiraceae bacterium]